MRFALLSLSPRVTAQDLQRLAAACMPALAAVAAAWSPIFPDVSPPTVQVVEKVSDFTADDIPGLFTPTIDQAEDLAYHYEKIGADGRPHPYMVILADASQTLASIQQSGWHEMAETLVDPHCARYDPAGWAIEVCDPVQNDNVDAGGVNLSPFVFPAWNGMGASSSSSSTGARSGPYDSAGLLTAPHTVRPDGYAMKQDGSEVTGDGYQHPARKAWRHCRRMKRRREMAVRWVAGGAIRLSPSPVLPLLEDGQAQLRRLG